MTSSHAYFHHSFVSAFMPVLYEPGRHLSALWEFACPSLTWLNPLEVYSLGLALQAHLCGVWFDTVALVNWLSVPLRKGWRLGRLLSEFRRTGVVRRRFVDIYFLDLFGWFEVLKRYLGLLGRGQDVGLDATGSSLILVYVLEEWTVLRDVLIHLCLFDNKLYNLV